jgi:hypothetical protein
VILSAARPSSSFQVVAHNVFWDHLEIFYLYTEMDNNEHTEMQLKFQDLPNPSVFVNIPKVEVAGLNLTAAHHAVIIQQLWVLTVQSQAFSQVVQLVYNRVPHTWLLNTRPSGCDNGESDIQQLSDVALIRVLNGLMSQPNITTALMYPIQE